MSAAGPVEMDLYNQQKAEENALKLAASFSNANKGPVVLDNFGFVSVQRPIGKILHSLEVIEFYSQCGNYGILQSPIFRKKFVKETFSLIDHTINCFHGFF